MVRHVFGKIAARSSQRRAGPCPASHMNTESPAPAGPGSRNDSGNTLWEAPRRRPGRKAPEARHAAACPFVFKDKGRGKRKRKDKPGDHILGLGGPGPRGRRRWGWPSRSEEGATHGDPRGCTGIHGERNTHTQPSTGTTGIHGDHVQTR
eukprot:gene19247-biopygen8450